MTKRRQLLAANEIEKYEDLVRDSFQGSIRRSEQSHKALNDILGVSQGALQ